MDRERSFLKAASNKFSRSEAEAFLGKLKTSGVTDSAVQFVQANKGPIAASTIGAAVGVLSQYLASKPSKKTGLSKEQEIARAAKAAAEASLDKERKQTGTTSYAKEMARNYAAAGSAFADSMSKHPVKAALLAAPIGATAGMGILRAINRAKRF